MQAFLPPEPLHPLVVHRPALAPQEAVGHPAAPADVIRCDLQETLPELGLLNRDNLAGMTLGAAVLAHHPADEAFRSPVTLPQDRDSPAATFRAQKFPVAPQGAPHGATRYLSMAFSSSASASSFHSFGEAFG